MELRHDTFERSLETMSEKIVTRNRARDLQISDPSVRPDAGWRIGNSTAAPCGKSIKAPSPDSQLFID